MKLMRWYLVVSAFLSVHSGATPSAEVPTLPQKTVSCALNVLGDVLVTGHVLRQEILHASELYQRSFIDDFFAVQSNLSPSPQFNPEISASWEFEFVTTAGGHVVSLGSGPDIFRPLFNFPFAEHIHLVDVLTGWHPNPNVAINELARRLKHIGPNAKVELIEAGFADARETANRNKPCQWKVSWDSSFAGRQTRHVSLHRKDYKDLREIELVLSHLGAEEISGLFISMARFPEGDALSLFLDKLKVGGVFHADMDYLNSSGDTSTPTDPLIRSQMEAKGMRVTHILPRASELLNKGPKYFWPNFYRFQKQ